MTMPTMQFISCSDESCPFNEGKSCRAPFIAINEVGKCMIREDGPFVNKAPTENYVEIRECRCQKCRRIRLDRLVGGGRWPAATARAWPGSARATAAQACRGGAPP